MKGLFTSRKFRFGAVATAITAVVVAIVIVINIAATIIADRYGLIADLTPTKLFSITDETKEYLKGLQKDVTIYVLDREETFTGRGAYYLQASEVLKKYALESSRINLVYKDLIADPTFAQLYPSLQLSSTSILVTCGDKVRDITPSQLYDIQSDAYGYSSQVTSSKAEQVLTSAILSVTSDKTIATAVISGHGEEDITSFRTLLTSNNYLVEDVNLLTEQIDPAFTAAIIAAPIRDYSEDELKALDRFLKNDGMYGKTLLYLSSSEQTDLPNLSAFLADWGIEVGEGMVLETNSALHYPNAPFMALLEYSETVYSESSQAAQLVPMTAYARPVGLLFESKNSVNTSVLLQFSQTAGIINAESQSVEPSGPIPYLVMGGTMSYSGSTPLRSQVVAAGSSALINQTFLSNANFANSEYMLSLFDTLCEREDAIKIQSKSIGSQPLNLNAAQAVVYGVVLTVIFPLALLIFGIVVWARRRHR